MLAALLALGIAIPALAAYLGPDRDYTVTIVESETVRDPAHDEWTLTGPEGSCSIIHTCDEHPGTVSYIPICGWSGPATNSSCTQAFTTIETTHTETHYHPEATIADSIVCGQAGANGWCIGGGSIELSANEPLGGYNILGIEGTLGGDSFFCPGTTCSVVGSPGTASASYWALSSYGDSSQMGSSTLKIDNDLPTIAGLVSGVQGNAGWYVGNITLAAIGADATSGLAAQEVQVDGGGWQNTSAVISSDGMHTVVFRATDQAGQENYTAPQGLRRDTAAPSISLDAYDAPASGEAMVAGTANDATSGVIAVHFSVNGSLQQSVVPSGGAWQLEWDSGSVPNGYYTLQVYAEDQAGHYSAPVQASVKVDNAAPYINMSSACWPIWQALDLDTGPGAAPISLIRLTVSDGAHSLSEIFGAPPQNWSWNRTFSDGSVAPVGDYSLQVYVEDAYGNSSSRSACIRIPPADMAASSAEGGPQTSTLQSFVPAGEPNSGVPAAGFANAQPSVTVVTELQPQPTFMQQLQQATPANAAVWGPAALTLAAAATAIAMAEKAKREEEERRRNEPDPFATYPNNLLAAHLSDKEVMAQVLAAGANPNISIEQARLITHNALKGKGSYSPTGAELNEQARQAAKETKVGGGAYTVKAGDNWFSIAEKVYGNQRMAGQLMEANGGVSMLQPGQTLALPQVSGSEAANPNFSPKTWDEVVKFTLAQEALRKAEEEEPRLSKGGPQRPPLHPNFPDGPAGLELALRMLAEGSLTPDAFHAAFPHVDLANAIYAANTGQLTPATVEWLWRENVYSQAALEHKQDTMDALRKGLIALQARDISEADLLEMFPHLPIDQARALLNDPQGLYNLWMTHTGKAWVQDIADRKAEEARQASYEAWRQGELEYFQGQKQVTSELPGWLDNITKPIQTAWTYRVLKRQGLAIEFRKLSDGKFSVAGPLNDGLRGAFNLPGTGPHNLRRILDGVFDGLKGLDKALGPISFAIDLTFNSIEVSNRHPDSSDGELLLRTLTRTAVDIVADIAIALVAAGIVVGIAAITAAVAPAIVIAGSTAVVLALGIGLGLNILLEGFGVRTGIKDFIENIIFTAE